MRLGVYYAAPSNPFGGTYTVKEDMFRALAAAVAGSGNELVVFSDDVSAAARFPRTGVSWVKVRGLWPGNGPPLYALRIGMVIDDEARFIGRMDELAALGSFMASADQKALLLRGEAGIGKSRLAIPKKSRHLSSTAGMNIEKRNRNKKGLRMANGKSAFAVAR